MVATLSKRSALPYKSDMPMAPRPMLETIGPCFPRGRFVTVRVVKFMSPCPVEVQLDVVGA